MRPFDPSTATNEEWLAERDRRAARQAAGLPLTPATDPAVLFVRAPAVPPLTRLLPGSVIPVEKGDVVVWTQVRRVRLPWSVLISDNRTSVPALRGTRAVRVMRKEYREAKKRARQIVADQMGHLPLLKGPLGLVATLVEPNRSRVRDVHNFGKLVLDALRGLVYVDDGQIEDDHWRFGRPDIDAPRLELEVRPLMRSLRE